MLRRHARPAMLVALGIGAAIAYGTYVATANGGLALPDLAFLATFAIVIALAVRCDTLRRRLAASRRRFRDFATANGDWLWETGPDLRFTYLSDNFPSVMGQAKSSVLGRTREELGIGEEMPEAWRRHLDDLAHHRAFRDHIFALELPSRERRLIKTSGVPVFDAAGRFRGYRGVSSDVTEQIGAERKTRRLEADLVRAQRLETLGAFAGGVAHDVNNALSPILTVTRSLMRRLADRPREREDLELVFEAAQRCRDLVSELLALVRRDGEADGPIDLKGPIADAVALLRHSITGRIRLVTAIEPVPMPVVSAPVKIIQIVANLVTNAAQAMGDGPGTIELRVAPAGAAGGYVIEVKDDGHGIEAELQSRIFEPFFTTRPRSGGSGLGLSAVHSLARGLGGRVEVESEPGAGACFRVFLPRATAAALEAPLNPIEA